MYRYSPHGAANAINNVNIDRSYCHLTYHLPMRLGTGKSYAGVCGSCLQVTSKSIAEANHGALTGVREDGPPYLTCSTQFSKWHELDEPEQTRDDSAPSWFYRTSMRENRVCRMLSKRTNTVNDNRSGSDVSEPIVC